MKRALAALLMLALLALPAALAEADVGARTPISGIAWEKLTNVELAARRVNGVTVKSGASFSFNETVNARGEGGFLTAANGRGEAVPGGGVEQAATTLCLALDQLGGDIAFTERHAYGDAFADGYVPDGASAVRVDDAQGLDLRFTNLGGDLRIGMYVSGANLFCTLSAAPLLSDGFLDWAGHGPQLRTPAAAASIPLDGTDALKGNVALAASSINDTVLASGGLFSFNASVGPREEEFGYRDALNGRGVEVVGGGVAQVASALWLAVKNLDDVAIVEKSTYGSRYNQHYVASSNDAILTDYADGTDFSFRNTGDSPLTIATYVRDDVLYCEIYRG